MLENRYKAYGDWDLRTLDFVPFLKAVPLCMVLSLAIGIWLANNIILWLVIGLLVGVVVACEEIFEKHIAPAKNNIEEHSETINSQPINSQSREGGSST